MPFPGGKHGLGHYVEAAQQGLIFVRSTGAYYNSVVDGLGPFTIPFPAGRQVDDMLLVYTVGTAIVDPTEGGAAWPPYNFGTTVEGYRRVATGDSNDNFTVPAHTGTVLTQMIAIGNNDVPAGKQFTLSQGGSINTSNPPDWNVDAMTAGADPDETAVILFCSRLRTIAPVVNPTIVNDEPAGMEVLGSQTVTRTAGQDQTLWHFWSFQYQALSVAMAAFIQGYTPVEASGAHRTQYNRFNLQ